MSQVGMSIWIGCSNGEILLYDGQSFEWIGRWSPNPSPSSQESAAGQNSSSSSSSSSSSASTTAMGMMAGGISISGIASIEVGGGEINVWICNISGHLSLWSLRSQTEIHAVDSFRGFSSSIHHIFATVNADGLSFVWTTDRYGNLIVWNTEVSSFPSLSFS